MTLQLVPLIAGAVVLIWALSQRAAVGRQDTSREVAAGLDVLRLMSWADFAQLVVQSFEARGFSVEGGHRKLGEGAIDIVLLRNDQRHLMQVKHGGAYHVGPGPVRALGTTVAARNAAGGIIATSGGFDPSARDAARGQPLTLLDGEPLWLSLRGLLPSRMVMDADERASEAAAAARKKANARISIGAVLMLAGGAWIAIDHAPGRATNTDLAAESASAREAVVDAIPTAVAAIPSPPTPNSTPPPGITRSSATSQRRGASAAAGLRRGGGSAGRWRRCG